MPQRPGPAGSSALVRARASSPAQWQRVTSKSFVPLSVSTRRPDTFRAELVGRRTDRVLFAMVRASAHTLERDAERIAASPGDFLTLVLQVHGSGLLVQDGREATVRPGDLVLYDTSRPYTLELCGDVTSVVLMFPHGMLDVPAEHVRHLTAVRIEGGHGFAGAVSRFLVGITQALGRLDAGTALRATHSTMDLVSTMLEHELGLAGQGDAFATLCHRIDAYITVNLADPTLGPEKIAAATYISTRYLHAIFHRRGTTVSRWVRERRLEHARRELIAPGPQRRSVAQIAAAWGFADPSHFSKVFREHHGVSPSRYRREART